MPVEVVALLSLSFQLEAPVTATLYLVATSAWIMYLLPLGEASKAGDDVDVDRYLLKPWPYSRFSVRSSDDEYLKHASFACISGRRTCLQHVSLAIGLVP